ncbi:MAG: RHS repeat-associated core domain-containing protein [Planctomyces sp.]|nr:RHS repeat-associated core domain-containing protein [Planctomyces sp.]
MFDHQNTVRDVAIFDGTPGDQADVVNHLTYNSAGSVVSADNPQTGTANEGDLPGLSVTGNEYSPQRSYTGREPDAVTRLIYYRARWYDPRLGRFISEDPIGFAAEDANLRRYVGNSMPNSVDPTGLDEFGFEGQHDLEEWLKTHPDHPWRPYVEQTLKNMQHPWQLEPSPSFTDQFKWGNFRDLSYQGWFERRYPGWNKEAQDRARKYVQWQLLNFQLSGIESGESNQIALVIPDRDKENHWWKTLMPALQSQGENNGETLYGDLPQSAREANCDGPGAFWFEVVNTRAQRVGNELHWSADVIIRDALGVSPQDRDEDEGAVELALFFGALEDKIVTHAAFSIKGKQKVIPGLDDFRGFALIGYESHIMRIPRPDFIRKE